MKPPLKTNLELKRDGFEKVSEPALHLLKDALQNEKRSLYPSKFFENSLLSYKEAAEYLCVSESYLRRLKAQGKIPYVLVGLRGIRFKVASLDAWVAEREVKK